MELLRPTHIFPKPNTDTENCHELVSINRVVDRMNVGFFGYYVIRGGMRLKIFHQ